MTKPVPPLLLTPLPDALTSKDQPRPKHPAHVGGPAHNVPSPHVLVEKGICSAAQRRGVGPGDGLRIACEKNKGSVRFSWDQTPGHVYQRPSDLSTATLQQGQTSLKVASIVSSLQLACGSRREQDNGGVVSCCHVCLHRLRRRNSLQEVSPAGVPRPQLHLQLAVLYRRKHNGAWRPCLHHTCVQRQRLAAPQNHVLHWAVKSG